MNIQVYADEISALKNSSVFSSLKYDSNESTNIDKTILDFISNSKIKLSGVGWDETRNKLIEFEKVLIERIEVAESLSSAIEAAMALISSYMVGYPYLDLSKLNEIKSLKQQCEINISYIESIMYSKKTEEIIDPETEEVKTIIRNAYTDAEISDFKSSIDKLKQSIDEMQKLIDKLEGLEAIYKEAEGMLQSAFEQIEAFGRDVKSIIPNNKVVYIK